MTIILYEWTDGIQTRDLMFLSLLPKQVGLGTAFVENADIITTGIFLMSVKKINNEKNISHIFYEKYLTFFILWDIMQRRYLASIIVA